MHAVLLYSVLLLLALPLPVHWTASSRPGSVIGSAIARDLSMTMRYVIGGILVVVGLVSLLLGGFRWTEEKTVVDVGPVKATAEEHKALPIPPVVGALALVGGIVLLVVPAKRRV
jgi:hypothetical protein